MSTSLTTQDTKVSTRSALGAALAQREEQSVQIAMLAAKRFPRNEKAAIDRIMNACARPSLASVAVYQYAKGGTDIEGPSIRLAEAVAQQWGNLDAGWRIIEQHKGDDGVMVSTVEAYAWDLESNCRALRVFTVRHWRDTRKGGYELKDEREIYELCANMAARRVRACLLAVIPGDVIEDALTQCSATNAANADTSPESVKKMVDAFSEVGVSRDQIEKRIQRRLEAITAAQFLQLRKIFVSIRDGISEPASWFDSDEKAERRPSVGSDDIQPLERPATETPEGESSEEFFAKQLKEGGGNDE